MHSLRTKILATCLSLAASQATVLVAQSTGDSPYGYYGFGELIPNSQAAQSLMGGCSVAVVDDYDIEQANPATFPNLRKPVFEVAGVGRISTLSSSSSSEQRNSGRFLGFDLGIPFGKERSAIVMGLHPISSSGYRILDQTSLSTGQNVNLVYSGNGGLNRAYIGSGFVLWRQQDSLNLGNGSRLSLGANVNYLFGSVERSRKAYYPTASGYNNSSDLLSLVVRDPVFTFGVFWKGDLIKRYKDAKDRAKDVEGLHYTIGVSMDKEATLTAHATDLFTTFILSSGVEYTRDTVRRFDDDHGRLTLPASYATGFSIYNEKWTWTGEMRMRDWSGIKLDVDGYSLPSNLSSSTSYAFGAAWRPAGDAGGRNFLERTIWRGGVKVSGDYLIVNGHQLTETSMSLGASFPILWTSTRSRITLGGVFGQRGTTSDGLLRERYVDLYFGISFVPVEPWFKKRRIE